MRRRERLCWEMRKQAQSMPSEGWWEAERWEKKDLIAQHAKKAMSSGQSAPLPSEAVFRSPAPLWPITTLKSQTRSWEKTSGQPPSVKKKIRKDENEILDSAKETEKHQDGPSPLPSRANLITGREPVVSRETGQSARLSAKHQGAACNPTNTHSNHSGQYSNANPLSFPVQFDLGGGTTRFWLQWEIENV